MSGETQLKPFFFADEAIFTATCIPPLNRFPTRPTKRQRAQGSPENVQHLLALEAPATTRCNPWVADACNKNLAGGTACESGPDASREMMRFFLQCPPAVASR